MKRKLAIISAIILVLAVAGSAVLFGACSEKRKWYGKTFYSVMNTAAQLVICGDGSQNSEENFTALCNETEAVIRDIENSLSVTVQTSSIAKFNVAEAGAKIEVDKTAYEVLSLAQSVYKLTDGYYNPAIYYNVRAYGFDGENNFPEKKEDFPTDEIISKYNELSAYFGELGLIDEDGKFFAVKPNVTVEIGGAVYSMKLDLGGIGKGYAVDKVNALIDEYGYKYGYFNFGSSSLAFKTYGENEPYDLKPINARGSGADNYLTVPVANVCASTSGDYEQYYELDGVRYCHVFNPKTGKPIQTGIMTATVIGGTAAEDDALTTALMAMGTEKAVEFINTNLCDRRVCLSVKNNGAYGIITNIPDGGYTVNNKNFTVLNALTDGKIVLGEDNVA